MTGGLEITRVGVIGATGYTGAEVVRLVLQHPQLELAALSARQSAGQSAAHALPALPQLRDLIVDGEDTTPQQWRDRGIELVFACLPHGAFAAQAPAYLAAGLRVVDLSADFRLAMSELYPVFYRMQHPTPQLLPQAQYGLCEWNDADLRDAALVANPGCYATAMLLAMLPAAAAGWLSHAPVLVNAVSGVSGAGRGTKLGTQFAEAGNSVSPYKVGEVHPHRGEVSQMLDRVGCTVPVIFNPHLVPMARGIAATVALPLHKPVTAAQAQELYSQRYERRPFVQVLGGEDLPETRYVRGSNRCDMAVRVVHQGHMLLVFSCIDNLLKGAAGQAVQNANRMLGLDDAVGLPIGGMACA